MVESCNGRESCVYYAVELWGQTYISNKCVEKITINMLLKVTIMLKLKYASNIKKINEI